MSPTNYFTLVCLKRNIQYAVIRYIRGGVTIPLKEPPKKPKPDKPFENNDKLFRKNEGINHRLRMFMNDGELETDDIDDMDDLEPQVMNFGRAYREHMEEMAGKDIEKHKHAVIRKYFKQPKLPNMLTYGEKQQIKRLHSDDPHLWNVDKLASCFPASPAIIQKILKADWKPKDKAQLLSHDKTVEKNWKLFLQRKLKFDDEDLQKHIAKFTKRHSIIYTETEINNLIKKFPVRPKAAEFGSIIEEYRQLTGKPDDKTLIEDDGTQITTTSKYSVDMESRHIKRSGLTKQVTLDKYREKLQSQEQIDSLDKLIIEGGTNNKSNGSREIASKPNVSNNDDVRIDGGDYSGQNTFTKYDSGTIDSYASNNTRIISKEVGNSHYLMDDIQLRIEIPEHLWKKGMTYKVRDCFYDDDGTFLYRVPGLVS